jgi:hypothetical protein
MPFRRVDFGWVEPNKLFCFYTNVKQKGDTAVGNKSIGIIDCINDLANRDMLAEVDAHYVQVMTKCGIFQYHSQLPGDPAAVQAARFRKIGDELLLRRKLLLTAIRNHQLSHREELIYLPTSILQIILDEGLAEFRRLETRANSELYLMSILFGFGMEDLLDPELQPGVYQSDVPDEFILVIQLTSVYEGSTAPVTRKKNWWDRFFETMQYVGLPFMPCPLIPMNEEPKPTEAAPATDTAEK